MEPARGEKELPVITTCFGAIFEKNQYPLRAYFGHNNADSHEPDDNKYLYKPDGYGLLGGGGEEGESPLQTALREVEDEGGLKTEVATLGGKDSRAGEILFESKPVIDTRTGKPAINKIYTFHLQRTNSEGFGRIKETDETGRLMLATFGSILTMPLARKKIENPNGSITVIENSEGIYHNARDRIFGVAAYLGYDFYELIPNLDELFPKLKREEVGWYIHKLLSEAIEKKKEDRIREERLAEEARLRRAKICGSPDDEELEERYADLLVER